MIFVFISIGFLLGKYSVEKKAKAFMPVSTQKSDSYEETIAIHVYYMHSTFRCKTCNTIEKMTKQLLDTKYTEAIQDKKIIFSDVDFQSNNELAKKFKIVSSCVVVAKEKNGVIFEFKRLDDVWTLLNKPNEFNKYISKAINSFLDKKGDTD